jgi:hypothetical protein
MIEMVNAQRQGYAERTVLILDHTQKTCNYLLILNIHGARFIPVQTTE